MTTLTTTGFGDIVALSNPARATVMIQMVVDVAILGVAVKLLVGVARTRLRGTVPRPEADSPAASGALQAR